MHPLHLLLAYIPATEALPALPTSSQEAVGVAETLWELIAQKQYGMAVGPGLALGLFLLRRYDVLIPKVGASIDKFLNLPLVAYLLPTVVAVGGGAEG